MVSMKILLWASSLTIGMMAHPVQDTIAIEPSFDFGGFNETSQQHYGHVHKRVLVKCSSTDLVTLARAYGQAKQMIASAKTAAANVLSILSDRQAAYQLGQSDEVKIQFETWCAIFGCGAAKLPFLLQSQINAIVGRAQYVSTAFTTLDARVTNSETLNNEFYCSDSWLTATDPAGNPFRDANGNVDASYFWDNRPTRPNEILDGWVDIANDKCDSDTMGFTIAEMWGYKGDVITHCADMFTNIWNPAQAAGQTIEQLCATKYNAGSNPSFDSLVRDKLARSFVHELMHSINAVGLRKVVDGFAYTEIDDQKCPDSNALAYGWQCIVDLAKESPDLAIKNADSYSYFAAAAYCKKNNWATGYPNVVPLVDKGKTTS